MKLFFFILLAFCLPAFSYAQEDQETHQSLGAIAREIKNPVSLLYRIPLRSDFEVGDVDNQLRYTLRAQPVVPFVLSERWKIITRSSLSLIANQFNGVDGGGPTGLNDLDLTTFLAPMKPFHGLVWGVGAAMDMPTATDPLLGAGKWTAGPSILALKQTKTWTFGLVARQMWSFAGDADRADVNYTYCNPWIYYTFENGFGLSLQSETTLSWSSGENTVPLRFGASRVFKMGGKLIGNIDLDGIYCIKTPAAGPKWGASLTFTILLKHVVYVENSVRER